MLHKLASAFLLLTVVSCRYSPDARLTASMNDAEIISEIRSLLDSQVTDWNAGDIEAFMSPYWRSDSLRFVSNGSVSYGWQGTLDNYHRRYPTRESMGTLSFSEVAVHVLTPNWATVFGRFSLERQVAGGGDLTGLFTLLLEHDVDGWLIVQDHTSTPK